MFNNNCTLCRFLNMVHPDRRVVMTMRILCFIAEFRFLKQTYENRHNVWLPKIGKTFFFNNCAVFIEISFWVFITKEYIMYSCRLFINKLSGLMH